VDGTDTRKDVDNPSNVNQSLGKMDVLGIPDPCESQTKEETEAAVLAYFERTASANPERRYEVNLPWLPNRQELPDNRMVAEKRSTTSRMKAAKKFRKYDEVMDGQNIYSSTEFFRVISRCTIFRRHEAKTTETEPAYIPVDRVRDASVLEVVGLDLAGLLYFKGTTRSWTVHLRVYHF
jgi:hypothetical protein